MPVGDNVGASVSVPFVSGRVGTKIPVSLLSIRESLKGVGDAVGAETISVSFLSELVALCAPVGASVSVILSPGMVTLLIDGANVGTAVSFASSERVGVNISVSFSPNKFVVGVGVIVSLDSWSGDSVTDG